MKQWKRWLIAAVMTGLIAHPAYSFKEFNWLVWRESIDAQLFLSALLLMAVTVGIRLYVRKTFGWSDWWLGRWFRQKEAPGDSLVEEPMRLHPLISGPYAITLLFTLPVFATVEELIFRQLVVTSIATALIWSAIFALAHLVMMVNLSTVVALFVTGFIFSMAYLSYGLATSVQLHFAFNVIGISVGVAEIQYKRYKALAV